MAKGLFIINSGGQVTWTDWAEGGSPQDGVKVVRGRIVTVTPRDQKALDSALESALKPTAGPAPLTVIVEGKDGARRHIIHVVPMRRAKPAETGADATAARQRSEGASAPVQPTEPPDGAMVIVVDPARGVIVTPELLQSQLGLSPSESRVAALVAAGERPRAVAEQLGLTEDSARVVLKRVFAKAGVSRQSELVALVSNLTSISVR